MIFILMFYHLFLTNSLILLGWPTGGCPTGEICIPPALAAEKEPKSTPSSSQQFQHLAKRAVPNNPPERAENGLPLATAGNKSNNPQVHWSVLTWPAASSPFSALWWCLGKHLLSECFPPWTTDCPQPQLTLQCHCGGGQSCPLLWSMGSSHLVICWKW